MTKKKTPPQAEPEADPETEPAVDPQEQIAELKEQLEELKGDRDTLAELHNAALVYRKKKAIHEEKTNEKKIAKAEMDAAAEEMNNILMASENDKDRPLFEQLEREPEAQPEPWRDDTWADLEGIGKSTADKLDGHELCTVGNVLDFLAEAGKLTDLDGVGDAKAFAINEVIGQHVKTRKAELRDAAEPWRALEVDAIGLPAAVAAFLLAEGIEIIGQIVDHLEQYELTDIAGIGQAGAKTITEAIERVKEEKPWEEESTEKDQ